MADRFIALAPYGSRPIDAPWSVAIALLNDPVYTFWSGDTDLVVPCLSSGVARITAGPDVDDVELEDCAMADDQPLVTGRGTLDWYRAHARLDVVLSGGSIDFRLDDGGPHATGTWQGRPYSYGG